MKVFRILLSNSIFALNLLLLFLISFRDSVSLPDWLEVTGRFHPLLIHLPIGFLVFAFVLFLFRSGFKKKSFHNVFNFILYCSAFVAVVAALLGLFLSTEGDYDPIMLSRHLIAGAFVSLLSAVLLGASLYGSPQKRLTTFLLILTLIAVILAGHFGSILTHGENFLFPPAEPELVITEESPLFESSIQPLFKTKCGSCHNSRKSKGKLVLTTLVGINKGGKDGAIWKIGDPDHSELIRRLYLPLENDDHMPPSGKSQLSTAEKRLLYLWILDGADQKTPWRNFGNDSVRLLAKPKLSENHVTTHYSFPFAKDETLTQLNSPFCNVSRIAVDEPAIKVDFFVAEAFNKLKLEELMAVQEQLVELNLSKMPVTDNEAIYLAKFKNLEHLNLNQTGITGKTITHLATLSKLQSLSLVGTNVDVHSLESLGSLPALREVYVWSTPITSAETVGLQEKFKAIRWNFGKTVTDKLKLTAPIIVNRSNLLRTGEGIQLKNNLPGSIIRFKINGDYPDSVGAGVDSLSSESYTNPIPINGYTELRARAFKPGWYGSPETISYFFKKGIHPKSVELLNQPDKDYKGEGGLTLIDSKKGSVESFKEITWIAYRQLPMEAVFEFTGDTLPHHLTLSYGENTGSFIFPPQSIEVWTGMDRSHLKLVKALHPDQPKEKGRPYVKGIVVSLPPGEFRFVKLIGRPLALVPTWVSKKPEKGWLFVDEVVFN